MHRRRGIDRRVKIVAEHGAKVQPVPKAGVPEDIARAALYLASEASSMVTGHVLAVDGGTLAS